jgi:glucan phosphoethanolaminetransferase (alkaline phosphatase superfamily)
MKKSIISIAIMTCAVFGASVLSTASLSGSVSAQVSKGIDTATTSEMKGKSIDGDKGLIKTVVNVLLWAVGVLSVIMIIFSGFRYITSAGDTSKTKSAQSTLIYSVVGLIVAIMAWAIVNMVINRL